MSHTSTFGGSIFGGDIYGGGGLFGMDWDPNTIRGIKIAVAVFLIIWLIATSVLIYQNTSESNTMHSRRANLAGNIIASLALLAFALGTGVKYVKNA
jgi:hypothetical protein